MLKRHGVAPPFDGQRVRAHILLHHAKIPGSIQIFGRRHVLLREGRLPLIPLILPVFGRGRVIGTGAKRARKDQQSEHGGEAGCHRGKTLR